MKNFYFLFFEVKKLIFHSFQWPFESSNAHVLIMRGNVSHQVHAYIWKGYNADNTRIPAGKRLRSAKQLYESGHSKIAKLQKIEISRTYERMINEKKARGNLEVRERAAFDYSFAIPVANDPDSFINAATVDNIPTILVREVFRV